MKGPETDHDAAPEGGGHRGDRFGPSAVIPPNPYEAALRQRDILLRVVRIAFAILFVVVTGLSLIGGTFTSEDAPRYWPLTLFLAMSIAAIAVAIDLLTPTKKISTIVSVMVGLMAAMLATAAVGFVIDLLASTYDIQSSDPNEPNPVISIIKILIGVGLAYLFISTVLQTQDDFRLVIPYVEFAKQIRGSRPLVLDTSSLIDARIADVAETGLIQAPAIVPRFVIEELQTLSDSGDKLKRARGRRGLDLVGKLQRSGRLDISIDETRVPGLGVDQMLIELGKQLGAIIVTTDSGLARVAGIQGVSVVNVNDLANAMKMSVIPGHTLRVHLNKVGEQPGQGVGYLEDGTMVVAEDGREYVGTDVELTVTSSMQTSAGKLIFGRVGGERADDDGELDEPEGDGADDRPRSAGPEREPRSPVRRPTGSSPRNPRR
ncbi:MAG: PIN/TRAM domain-containing protein [Phycisphaeraceae bacterium]|nr:MAG: PIN/TRAM domain-containing protein [Phycisphaeraceae bacterium]